MKTLINTLFLSFVLSFVSFSQEKITYNGYKQIDLYSDIWRAEYKTINGQLYGVVKPKDGKYFSMNTKRVKERMDTNKINGYLLSSINEFRKDYGLSYVTENKALTKIAKSYVKTLSNSFSAKHSDLTKNEVIGSKNGNVISGSETIGEISLFMLTNIPEDRDINKVIADCIFDIFVVCPAHGAVLIKDCNNYQIGFGVDYRENDIMIVLQFVEMKKGS